MGFFYLGLAFLGAIAPYSFMGQFLLTHGLNLTEFQAQITANPISSYAGASFVIAGLVTLFFIIGEGKRLKMKGLWLPLLATALVGASCGLPLFLYLRGLTLAREKEREAAAEAANLPQVVKR